MTKKKLAQNDILPMGNGQTMLVEFSSRHSVQEIGEAVERIQAAGYQPLIAHVERYDGMERNPRNVELLREKGAKIQVNCGSVLGREGFFQKRFVMKLLKEKLVDVIGSDAHDLEERPSELMRCAELLSRKTGGANAEQLLSVNPQNILGI